MANFRPDRRSRPFNRDRGDRNNFNRPRSGFGGRFRDQGRGGFRNRDSERSDRPTEMYDVTCSKCGKRCQVPFKPTGSRPVFCSECFEQKCPSKFNSRNQDRRFSEPPPQGNSSEQFNQINAKLDQIIKILRDLEIYEDEESDEDSDE